MKKTNLYMKIRCSDYDSFSTEEADRLKDAFKRGDQAMVRVFIKAIKNGIIFKAKKETNSSVVS